MKEMKTAYIVTYLEVIDDRGADEDSLKETEIMIYAKTLLGAKRMATSMYPQFSGSWTEHTLSSGSTEYFKTHTPEGRWYHDTLHLKPMYRTTVGS